MRTREQDVEPFVNLSELTEIELLIMRRMREFAIGEHRSVFHGSGFDLVGLRDWQAGDRMSNIDWPQSTLTNFSPMVVREFEQRSTATVIAVADGSLSTRCGIDGIPIAAAIARTIGTVGMSAVFFQDMFGLITFDAQFEQLAAIRPRIGKNQVIHCLDAFDVETGRSKVMSRRALRTLSARTRTWQDEVARMAKAADLDVLRIGVDEQQTAIALSEFIAERRLRKAA